MTNKEKKLLLIGLIMVILFVVVLCFVIFQKRNTNTDEIITIKFDSNGGSSVLEQQIKKGEYIKKPVDPVKDGYIFTAWKINNVKYDFSLKPDKDLVLVAEWLKNDPESLKYIVKFDTDGGTSIQNQVVEKDGYVQLPKHPQKEGYKFNYWLLDGDKYDFSSKVDTNLTLVAKWEKEEIEEESDTSINNNSNQNNIEYKVFFKPEGGSKINSQTVKKGKKAKKPTDPIMEGYKFLGWTLKGKFYDFSTPVNKNITLIAKWEKNTVEVSYEVKFDSNGGNTLKSQKINEGEKAKVPERPTKKGYKFICWLYNNKPYSFSTPVTNNITLVAKWEKEVKKNYTVTFDSNGGNKISSQSVLEGEKVLKPSNPTKDGYTFVGWILNEKNYDFNAKVNNNITLVAKWQAKTYTVKVSLVDQYSPDRILTVYEDGIAIEVSSIKYNGTVLCSGSNTVVNMYDIEGINTLTIVLKSGKNVNATIQ